MKIPIEERALLRRLQRALQDEGKELRKAQALTEGVGRYYLVGPKGVIDPDVDLEKLARELSAMETWEMLKR
jgi:hypothetical protein